MPKIRSLSLLVSLLVLGPAASSFADIGVLVLEPIKTLGFLTRAGHSAVYLSNICPDGSPVRLRLCHAGEHGGVISKYTPISEDGDYDWAIVPFEPFLNGFASDDFAPLIATTQLRDVIQNADFAPFFSTALRLTPDQGLPEGEWKATLATRFDRTIYNFSIATTLEDDQRIVDAFNQAGNRSHFNLFYDNCSDQTRAVFALVLPSHADIGDRTNGLTMETPKGLAKALVGLARAHPEMRLRVQRYVQTPGTAPRSREALFPMENVYQNPSFAPYWFFGGFREFAIGAFLYHRLFSRFSIAGAYTELAPAADGPNDWDQLRSEFQATVRSASRTVAWPPELQPLLTAPPSHGQLARKLLQYFEANGRFFIGDSGHGPWMALDLDESEAATGISLAEIDAGDPRIAFLVLTAVIDYHLSAPENRREALNDVSRTLGLLREAEARLRPVTTTTVLP